MNTFYQELDQFSARVHRSRMQLIAFSSVLWLISHELVYFLLVYTIIGSLVTTLVFGRPLTGLNFLQLKKEADFASR